MKISNLLEVFGELQGKYGDLQFQLHENAICVPTNLSFEHIHKMVVSPEDEKDGTYENSHYLAMIHAHDIVDTKHTVCTWGTTYMYTLNNGSQLWVRVAWFRDFSGFHIDQLQFFPAKL